MYIIKEYKFWANDAKTKSENEFLEESKFEHEADSDKQFENLSEERKAEIISDIERSNYYLKLTIPPKVRKENDEIRKIVDFLFTENLDEIITKIQDDDESLVSNELLIQEK
jgi:hypothetical protein